MMNLPIFIIGSPRSGTTLIRLILTCHKNIVIPPECGFAVWFYDKYKNWEQPGRNDPLLKEFIRDLMHSRKIEHWKIDEKDLAKFLQQRAPSSYPELVSCVYEWYGVSQGRNFRRWGDKNNFHIDHILTIKDMFPTTYFVHIVRDGRDVACSYKKLSERNINSVYAPRLPDRIEDIAEQWKNNIEIATRSFASIGWENVCEVRFEDLILETEATLRNLCNKLNEDYDPSMLEYHLKNAECGLEPKEFLPWKEKNLRPPIPTEVGRYKSELSEHEIHVFESIAGRELGNLACRGD